MAKMASVGRVCAGLGDKALAPPVVGVDGVTVFAPPGSVVPLVADGAHLKMGFHSPPFNSIDHIHLHVIDDSCSTSLAKIRFHRMAPWFKTYESLAQQMSLMSLRPSGIDKGSGGAI